MLGDSGDRDRAPTVLGLATENFTKPIVVSTRRRCPATAGIAHSAVVASRAPIRRWTSGKGRSGYPSASSEVISLGIRKVDEMGSWLVPPIVIPVLIVIMVVVYGLYRAYS